MMMMMMRHSNNSFKTYLAPFVLAPVGVLKGVIFGIPMALAATLISTLIVLVCLPYNLLLAMRTLYTTAYLGPHVRVLLLFFLPFVVVIYPIAFFTVALVVSIGYDVFGMAASVFVDNRSYHDDDDGDDDNNNDNNNDDDDNNDDESAKEDWWGVLSFYKDTLGAVKQVYRHVYVDAYETTDQWCHIPQTWNGQNYEIPLNQLAVGVFLLVCVSAIGAIVCPLLTLLKFPCAMYHANKEYFAMCWRQPSYWLLLEALGFVALNGMVLPLVVLVVPPLYGLSIGICCASEALRVNDMKEGFRESLRILREYDVATTDMMVFGGDDSGRGDRMSVIPIVSPPIRLATDTASLTAQHPDAKVMDEFFGRFEVVCRKATREALHEDKWIDEADLNDLAPYVFLGIPGIAIFDIVRQSAKVVPGKDELVYCLAEDDGSTRRIRGEDVPKYGIANTFWPRLMKAKADLEKADCFTDDEAAWIRCHLLVNGAERTTPEAEAMLARFRDRKRFGAIVSTFYSLAIDISKLSRTGQIISGMAASGNLAKDDDIPRDEPPTV